MKYRHIPLFLIAAAALTLTISASGASLDTMIGATRTASGETPLGNVLADGIRAAGQADAALVPANEFGISLPAGALTETDLAQSCPIDDPLGVAQITQAALEALLEQSVSSLELTAEERIDWDTADLSGILAVSGLKVTFDLSAPVGQRLYRLTDADGGALPDPLTLAAPVSLLEEAGLACTPLPLTRRAALEAHLDRSAGRPDSDTGRVILLGANANGLIQTMPAGLLILAVVIMAVFSGVRYREKTRRER